MGLADEVEAFARREPAAMADRWSLYERLRATAPFYRFRSTTLVTRYHDVARIFSDEKNFETGPFAAGGNGFRDVPATLTPADQAKVRDIVEFQSHWMTATNGAKHDQLRQLGVRVFSVKAINAMQDIVDRVVDDLLTEAARSPEIELISQVAYRLPLTVISEILDISVELREHLHETWQSMIKFLGGLEWRPALPANLAEVHASYLEMGTLLQQYLDEKRKGTDSELLGRLFAAQAEGIGVTDGDLIGIISQLFTAGHQTTQDLLGNAVYTLMTHRDQWEDVVADPGLIKGAVEEVLRFRSPAQDMERTAVNDVPFEEHTVAAGDHLTCLIGSANHDPAVFGDPGVFDIRRADVRSHIAFSLGPHFCLGAALSRIEAAAGLRALARRFPDVDLASADIAWMPNTHLMGVAGLPLRLGPERG